MDRVYGTEETELINRFVDLRLVLETRGIMQYHEKDGVYTAICNAERVLRDRLDVIYNGQYLPFETQEV